MSVNRYGRRPRPSFAAEKKRAEERLEHQRTTYNDLWRTLPKKPKSESAVTPEMELARRKLGLPEENLLYFIEKFSPSLKDWERELVRIVRNIAQYFYPQKQTKMMNEGCATYVHYQIMNRLYDLGQDQRRLDARVPVEPGQRGVPARFRRPALFRPQSLRPRLRHDVATSSAS